jgi:purine-binding chemotaxis protein CheW
MTKTVVQDLYEDEDTLGGRYLTFALGSESYGIEIRYVTEIIGTQPVTEVPELPTYIRGIINLRGKIVPVMDVRLRFKKQFREYNDRTCIIVIDIKEVSIGLIVDSVSEVISIPDSEIVAPPEISKVGSKYVKGIGKVNGEVKLLLDCDRMLNDEDVEKIGSI